jgi:hypothetical protein
MNRMLAVAGIMLASAGVVIANPASADTSVKHTCDVASIVNSRVADLGTDRPWTIGDTPGALALTYSDEVVVSHETSCNYDLVISIVNHEWVHTKQYVRYHTRSAIVKALGVVGTERIADCGSQLLGSKMTPYLDETGPCTDTELMEARYLIELPVHNLS